MLDGGEVEGGTGAAFVDEGVGVVVEAVGDFWGGEIREGGQLVVELDGIAITSSLVGERLDLGFQLLGKLQVLLPHRLPDLLRERVPCGDVLLKRGLLGTMGGIELKDVARHRRHPPPRERGVEGGAVGADGLDVVHDARGYAVGAKATQSSLPSGKGAAPLQAWWGRSTRGFDLCNCPSTMQAHGPPPRSQGGLARRLQPPNNTPPMIVSCPECGARYRLADTAIPADGRAMRCASCKHRWFELGPEPVEIIKLRDIADRPPQSEAPIFPPDPSPEAPTLGFDAPAGEAQAASRNIDYLTDDERDEPQPGHPVLKTVLALILGLGFSAAAAAMWVPDLPTVSVDLSRLPWLERIVAPPAVRRNPVTVRFSVDPQPVPGGRRIVFSVSGTVANPSDEPQAVPKLEGRLVDPAGAVSYRWRIAVPGAVLLPGQEVAFDASALGSTGERVVVAH